MWRACCLVRDHNLVQGVDHFGDAKVAHLAEKARNIVMVWSPASAYLYITVQYSGPWIGWKLVCLDVDVAIRWDHENVLWFEVLGHAWRSLIWTLAGMKPAKFKLQLRKAFYDLLTSSKTSTNHRARVPRCFKRKKMVTEQQLKN